MPTLTHNGASLYYEVSGSGAPLVYICGFGSHNADLFATTMRQQLSQFYTVLIVDNRGAGQTTVGASPLATVEDMADDIAAVMDHLNMDAAHVLGQSLGGGIALALALRHPKKVRTLVPIVATAKYSARAGYLLALARDVLDQGSRELYNRYLGLFLLGDVVFHDEGFLGQWKQTPADPLEQSREGFEHQLNASKKLDVKDQLKNITAPTLVISSPDDYLALPQYQDELKAGIPGAEIKKYEGGHLFFLLPTSGAQFAQDMMAFFAKHEQNKVPAQ